MASPIAASVKRVKPLLSRNREEARRRVLKLYKSWYRQLAFVKMDYDIDKSTDECKKKLREEFMRHQNVTDVRIIDNLVIKGQQDLQELAMRWKTKAHVMFYWHETHPKKPTDFMSKFLAGQD